MFRRTYDEILELIIKTALDADMARRIVDKSGLRAGEDDGSFLEAELLAPTPYGAEAKRPRRRSRNDLPWPLPIDPVGAPPPLVGEGNTYWDTRSTDPISGLPASDTTIGSLASVQTRWNGMHFPGHGDHGRPPLLAYLDPPNVVNSAATDNRYRAFVTGGTVYDPFPYPDAPYYLWADCSNARVKPYYGAIESGVGSGPLEGLSSASGPILLRCYGSLDNGATWQAPWEYVGGGDSYYSMEVNPAYTPSSGEEGSIATHLFKEAFRQDDVLFKFTLTTTDPEIWVQFDHLGILIYDR